MPNPDKPLPKVSNVVSESPMESEQKTETPRKTPVRNKTPNISPENKTVLTESDMLEETPEVSPESNELPEETPEKTELPPKYNPENCVEINGEQIEIKPTKMKYFRNKTANAYNLLKAYPLSELVGLSKGVIDDTRDGDAVVYDFLVACFNDSEFVRDNYNEFDADQVERVIKIVGRLNHIDEKQEAQRKNREAQVNR